MLRAGAKPLGDREQVMSRSRPPTVSGTRSRRPTVAGFPAHRCLGPVGEGL